MQEFIQQLLYQAFPVNEPAEIAVAVEKCFCGAGTDNPNTFDNNGFIVCFDCGYSYRGGIIDNSPEWNNYEESRNSGIDNARCGKPGGTLATSIPSSRNPMFERLRKLLIYSTPYNSNQYKRAELNRLLAGILPECIPEYITNTVIDLYSKIDKIYRGNNRLGVLCVLFHYISNQQEQCSFTKEQAMGIFCINSISFNNGKKILANFKNVINLYSSNDPVLIAGKRAKELGFSYKQVCLCENVTRACLELNVLGNSNPETLGNSVVYFVSKETGLEINDSGNAVTSIFTLKKNYKELCNKKQLVYNYILDCKNLSHGN